LLVELDLDGPVAFDGYYKNEGATKKKILTDVFVKGDA
jgi:long-subunit acyl-CoA synthetase (AMP-forming)